LVRVSPDGRWLVYQSNAEGNWDLYLARSDGGGSVRLTEDPGDETEPAFSPDGNQVAYSFVPAGASSQAPRDIRLISRNGGESSVVIQNPADDWNPCFLPDGSGLLFLSDRDDTTGRADRRQRRLYLYSFRDGQVSAVHSSHHAGSPGWSPAGRKFVFRDGGRDYYLSDSTLTEWEQFTLPEAVPGRAGGLCLGDGDLPPLACFAAGTQGHPRIWLWSVGRPEARAVTPENLDARFPVFAPGNQWLYFCARNPEADGDFDLYRVPLQ
jgi:Tol biopolymer transport system component